MTGCLAVTHVYGFLAVHRPIAHGVLVVEGWMDERSLSRAAEIYLGGGYTQLLTTGGPIERRRVGLELDEYAALAARTLRESGVPPAEVIAVPTPWSQRDRTFESARSVLAWLNDSGVRVDAIDLVSEGPHTRRSWELYRRVFADSGVSVGALAVRPPDYDPGAWWESSAGVKNVLTESIGWLFMRCCFRPEPRVREAGIGVTAMSGYPVRDAYYRLRRYGFGSFEVAPHPDDVVRCTGRARSELAPRPDVWYRFRLQAFAEGRATRVRASVWRADDAEPTEFEIDCLDAQGSFRRGAPGLWAMGPGVKLWDDLELRSVEHGVAASLVTYAEDFEAAGIGVDPPSWLGTGPDNSLAESPGLFHTFRLSGGGVAFGTASTATNVHAHLVVPGIEMLAGYELRGRMGFFEPGSMVASTLE